jgi:hypothetical protein
MRLAASRTLWTAARSNPIRMAMMAMTTNSSMSVKANRRRDEQAEGMECSPFAGPGKKRIVSAREATQQLAGTDCFHACSMLKAEASEQELGRQVFWLMARNGP